MGTCQSREDVVYHHHHQPLQKKKKKKKKKKKQSSSINISVGDGHESTLVKENSTSPQSSQSFGSKNATSVIVIPKNVKDLRQSPGNCNLDIFTYQEMRLATKQFRPDQVLGEGGFGIVYKGVIDDNVRSGYKRTQVAIKELDPEGIQGDREWLAGKAVTAGELVLNIAAKTRSPPQAEVKYLGQLQHPNLVKLIGYCCDDDHRLLVYEYMASGSLEKHLFRRVCATLTWSSRLKIALDAAKGLAFLHGAERSIIYRDFKTSNILLDADYNAKLSDFGLAKDGPVGDQTHVSTRVMGTYGYAAPEYVMTGHLTARSDVYGFGVVLLELLIGRRAMDKSRPSREHNLVEWARPILNHGKKLLRILDPRMEGQYSNRIAIKVANLAYQCLSQNPKARPEMSQVVDTIESLRTREGFHEEMLLSGGSVTLYEVQKSLPDVQIEEKTCAAKGESERNAETPRSKTASGRSNSEPPKEFDLYYGPCPNALFDERSDSLRI